MNTTDFELLFERHFGDVIRVLSFYTRDKEKIQDWAHEVFIKVWEQREKIDVHHPHVKAYILTIARNHSLKYLRDEQRLSSPASTVEPASENTTESYLDFLELESAYYHVLRTIGEKPRKVFLLNREQGMNYQQISDELGISVKTVEAHISSTLKILRVKLKGFR